MRRLLSESEALPQAEARHQLLKVDLTDAAATAAAVQQADPDLLPAGAPHSRLITPVTDRPDHERR